jgi:hypothetical protein
MRTMTAVRDYLQLTRRGFEAIVHRAPGYQSFLPPAVIGITVHPPGWTPTHGVFFVPARNPEPLWGLRTLRRRYRAFLLGGHPLDFTTIRDIPDSIMKSMRLVP